jgi:DivIVA domain-containing protein
LELDRDYIERRDFPAARRGYDPEAVDRHLADIAAQADHVQRELEELRRSRSAEPPAVSGAAAEQVRIIVEAAEQSAATIEAQAREDADRRGREAEDRARQLAGVTDNRVGTLVSRVDEVTAMLLQRVDQLERELSTLREGTRSLNSSVESLGDRTSPLRSEIEEMQSGIHELRDDPDAVLSGGDAAAGATVLREPEDDLGPEPEVLEEEEDVAVTGAPGPRAAEEEIVPEATPEPSAEAEEEGELLVEEEEDLVLEERPSGEGAIAGEEPVAAEPELEPATVETEESPRVSAVDEGVGADLEEREELIGEAEEGDQEEEGARLVALNMALNGVPREETDRYLADNFDLTDRGTVLDDVYARVGES